MADSPLVYVHLLPAMIPAGSLRGGVAVVLDVLRATSVMIHALNSGASAIFPCLEIDEARALASHFKPGDALLAGEREGLTIEGFDYGNSPGSFTPEVCRGKTIVMTTTNGTRAILASLEADRVLIGSFLNFAATLKDLRREPRSIHLLGSGTNGFVSYEDSLLAGAFANGLAETHLLIGNDETLLTRAAFLGSMDQPLATTIGRGFGGRRVREIGLAADLAVAADVDRIHLVAEVVRDPTRIVRSNSLS